MKHIKLACNHVLPNGERGYKVINLRNSVEYEPGDLLIRAEVERLCEDKRWDVMIIPPLNT